MEQFEEETGKYAIWKGAVTEGFKKWLRGEKIYNRDKERIGFYVSKEIKTHWKEFVKNTKYTSISKVIRDAVKYFIDVKSKKAKNENPLKNGYLERFSSISHEIKDALTSLKGYAQLLIENYKEDFSEDILLKVKEIFDKSIFLENKIKEIFEDTYITKSQYDILLIEDDPSIVNLLTSFFQGKGYSCKGVISGSKGLEELKRSLPKIILLDIVLPDISGFDICKMIKSDKRYQKILVFFPICYTKFRS